MTSKTIFTLEKTPESATNAEVIDFLTEHWGSKEIVSRKKLTNASGLPRVIARDQNRKLIGLATYNVNDKLKSCELVSIDAVIQGQGIGSQLLTNVEIAAKEAGCNKIWLITTNDNPEATAFYVKKGYRLVGVHLNALDKSRELKPLIPKIGNHGIPLQDEWEFEKVLGTS
jgi:GNAT superfamily N-acetyltransferase